MSVSKRAQLYPWIIFSTCFLMIFFALGFNSSPKSLFLAAITEDLEISRSSYSISDSCRYITTALLNLVFGTLVGKFGAKRLAMAGFGCLFLFNLLNSLAQSVFVFYAGGVLFGMGLAWTTTALVSFVVEKWFTSKKGTIMGFILAANGLGGALSAQILSPIIESARDGWRSAYRLNALLTVIVAVVVLIFLRNQPENLGLTPLGTEQKAKTPRQTPKWEGIELSAALRQPYFYLCILGVLLTGMILQAVTGISSAHMRDRGLTAQAIATALSIHSLCLAGSKILTGFIHDKFGLRVSMLSCNIFGILAITLLAFVQGGTTALMYQVFSALALPLETIMLPLLTADLFGKKSYSSVLGLMLAFNTLGYAIGGPIMNACYDQTGTYTGILLIMAAVMLLVSILMQAVITMAHTKRT